MRSKLLLWFPGALLAVACATEAAPRLNEPFAELTDDHIVVRTGHFPIAEGDVFECFYTPLITDRDVLVGRASGAQEEGGHHLTIHYTMAHRPVGHHTCDDAEMATWRQIGAAEEGEMAEYWIDGLGMRIPAGAQIVLQAHYINLAGHERMVEDHAEIFLRQPSEIRHLAAPFVVHDDAWEIPARSGLRHTAECTVARDMQIGLLLGHLHEWGMRFRLEATFPDGSSRMLYDESWEASYSSHPPVIQYGIDTPLMLPMGTRLRQICEWMNPESEPMLFPREMCVGYMVSFPSETGEMEFCEVDTRSDEMTR